MYIPTTIILLVTPLFASCAPVSPRAYASDVDASIIQKRDWTDSANPCLKALSRTKLKVGQVAIVGANCAEGVLGFIVEEHCFKDIKVIRSYTAKDRTGFCVYDETFTLPSSEIAKHVAVKTPDPQATSSLDKAKDNRPSSPIGTKPSATLSAAECESRLGSDITPGKALESGESCAGSGGKGFIFRGFCFIDLQVIKSYKAEKGVCVHKAVGIKPKP